VIGERWKTGWVRRSASSGGLKVDEVDLVGGVDLVDGVELFECWDAAGGSGAMMMFACPRRTGSFVE
jgi:hypothetical protein